MRLRPSSLIIKYLLISDFIFDCRQAMEQAVVFCTGICLYHDKNLYYDECFDKCNRY